MIPPLGTIYHTISLYFSSAYVDFFPMVRGLLVPVSI